MQNTPRGKIVGFDLDGVIIDHTVNKIRIAAHYGVHLEPPETHAECMGAHFAPEIYKEIKMQLYNNTDDALSAPLMEGAFDGLATLYEEGIPYVLISLQQNPIFAQRLIERHGLWGTYFTPENMFFARDGAQKSAYAAELGVTYFTDDEPNILDLMLEIPHRVLFDVHDQFPDRDGFVRVRNWSSLVDLLLRA